MERSKKKNNCLRLTRAVPPTRARARSGQRRRGMITVVTLLAILGLLVLAGFVGNVGHMVVTKVKNQNAADAIAFSSAQWMARGMNAITATNHLLGEATALVVVIEGLGGPEADHPMQAYPPQSQITDKLNQNFAKMAAINGLAIYGATLARKVDEPFVNAVVTRLISRTNGRHRAFATIYDAKLELKKDTAKRLIAKSIANAGLWVPPWWGWISAPIAYGVHIKCNKDLLEFGIEYVILEALERLVRFPAIKFLKVDILEKQLIPAIAAHGDYLAGRPSLIAGGKRPVDSRVVTDSIDRSLEHLGKAYEVKAALFPTTKSRFVIQQLRLPIAPEAPPSMKGTDAKKYEPEWGEDKGEGDDPSDPLRELQEKMADNRRKTERQIQDLKNRIKFLEDLFNEVQDLKERAGGDKIDKDAQRAEREAYQQEQEKIATAISEKKKQLKAREDDLKKIKEEQQRVQEMVAQLAQVPEGSGNPSARPENLALKGVGQAAGLGAPAPSGPLRGMNQAEERTTQWVRATYPYVDAFRAPIIALFESRLEHSGAAKYYKKWTDRYTLVKSWQFRSGYRFRKAAGGGQDNDAYGEWYKDRKFEPLTMYVMVERFEPVFNPLQPPPLPRPGQKRVQKGYEEWTKDTESGKNMAEDMLTMVAMTHREIEPLFSPVVYPAATKRGITTFAQAMYYNGNEQTPGPEKPDKKPTTQAKVGWDTLNWEHTKPVPEWGTQLSRSSAKWPWDLFESSEQWRGNAAAKLNWQAKLMPVTFRRLAPGALAALETSEDMAANVGQSLIFFGPMVTH